MYMCAYATCRDDNCIEENTLIYDVDIREMKTNNDKT